MTFLTGLVLFAAVFMGVGIPLVSLFYSKTWRMILGYLFTFVFLGLALMGYLSEHHYAFGGSDLPDGAVRVIVPAPIP